VAKKYAISLVENILQYCLIKKSGMAHTLGTSKKEDTQRRINLVDEEGVHV
jgi:hypothetical protein